jgi:ADP-heptose:LPS heptosyltransferase
MSTSLPSLTAARRVCVVANPWPGGIGDILLFNVFLALAQQACPQAKIDFVVGAGPASSLWAGHMYADNVITCPDDYAGAPRWWDKLFRELRAGGCECCVFEPMCQGPLAAQAARHGIPVRVGIATGDADSDRFLTVAAQVLPSAAGAKPDLLDYSRALATALGLPPPGPADVVPAFRYCPEPVALLPRPVVAVHPGGAPDWNRRWPLARYGELCHRLAAEQQASFLLVGAAGDAPELALLRDAVLAARPGTQLEVSAGRSLHQLASQLRRADVLVGNDSAPAHIAAALGVRTVVLYGPSANEYWCRRVYLRHRAVNHHHVCGNDRRCFGSQTAPCRFSCQYPYQGPASPYPRCLTDIELGEVLEAVQCQLRATR